MSSAPIKDGSTLLTSQPAVHSMLCATSILAVAFASVTAALTVLASRWRSFGLERKGLRELPGPQPRFLLKNLLDLPSKDVHLAYARLSERYGPIMKFDTPTSTIVVLSSAKVVQDLLEKRGAISSTRPPSHMAKLAGWDWSMVLMDHGSAWRARRRVLHQYLGLHMNGRHAKQHEAMALVLAGRLLQASQDFIAHLKRASAANILRTTYGIDVGLDKDPFVQLADDAMRAWGAVAVPGIWSVDWIPIIKYLPRWFPGASFKRFAQDNKKYPDAMLNAPFAETRREMEAGTAKACMVSEWLELESGDDHITVVKEAAGIMYLGGADTSSATLQSFVIEMIHNHDVQRVAQEELDRVIGTDRLPTLADRASLPYIEAIVREVFRKHPVATTGVAHALEEDEIYEGMVLRKDTVLMANIWAILHDPALYAEPHIFRPDRFLRNGEIDKSVTDPKDHCFGYGRRICPGLHYADEFIFICIAIILACFKIERSTDDKSEGPQSYAFHHAIISVPLPFKCTILPRSDRPASLISQALDAME